MRAVLALAARVVISFVLIFMFNKNVFQTSSFLEFIVLWFLMYAIVSVYYHARKIISENFGGAGIFIGNFLLDLALQYVILPILAIFVVLFGIPSLVGWVFLKVGFSDELANNIQTVVGVLVAFGIIVYDVMRIKDEIEIKRFLSAKDDLFRGYDNYNDTDQDADVEE